MDLLKWAEGYLKQKAADFAGAALIEYGSKFTVTVQDSWGSLEVFSVEELQPPLPTDTERIRLSQVCFDGGQEYFSIHLTFARNPAHTKCQLRLTGDTAQTEVNGLWGDIRNRVRDFPVKSFVRRFRTGWLVCILVAGLVFGGVSAVLFATHLFTAGSFALGGALFSLMYVFSCSRMPHCVFDTLDNEGMLDWNKWFYRALITSVVIAVSVRLILKFGFDL
jgi:hypothetical protein